MTTCSHCGAETSNGLVLCDLSQMKAAKSLEFVPVYFRNLARWRPGNAGARTVPGSRVLYDGQDRDGSPDRIQRALEQASNDITRLAERLSEDRGLDLPDHDTEATQVAALCRLLAEHITTISATEWAGVFVRKLALHERILSQFTEEVAPGWYAGACNHQLADTPDGPLLCEAGIYVIPGLTWVTCRTCGKTSHARDHLPTVLDEASDWIARPKALAEAIVALVDSEQSVTRIRERIKKWSQRKKIPTHRATETNHFGVEVPVGPKRYRLGDVLDLVLARTDETTKSGKIGA